MIVSRSVLLVTDSFQSSRHDTCVCLRQQAHCRDIFLPISLLQLMQFPDFGAGLLSRLPLPSPVITTSNDTLSVDEPPKSQPATAQEHHQQQHSPSNESPCTTSTQNKQPNPGGTGTMLRRQKCKTAQQVH